MLDEKIKADLSNLTEEECWMILFLLACGDAEKNWYEFKKEVSENNRFFPKAKLLEIVRSMKDDVAFTIKKGNQFYRARLFNTFFLENHKKEMKELEDAIVQCYPELKGKTFKEMDYILNSPFSFSSMGLYEKLVSILKKRKQYWGYNSSGSDAPPCDRATAGRANPAGISYLYLCDSIKTAIMEVRPMIGQEVSVATIEMMEDVKIFDFCRTDINFVNGGDSLHYSFISRAFSEPYTGKENDYYPTQYLCEFIKELGFDGIRYYSSLDNSAKDIVLFDTKVVSASGSKKYKVKNSKVYMVKEFHLEVVQVAPWKGDICTNSVKD